MTKPESRQQRYAVAVRAGESELIGAIDQIIDDMREGRLAELRDAAVQEFNGRGGNPAIAVNKNGDPSDCRDN